MDVNRLEFPFKKYVSSIVKYQRVDKTKYIYMTLFRLSWNKKIKKALNIFCQLYCLLHVLWFRPRSDVYEIFPCLDLYSGISIATDLYMHARAHAHTYARKPIQSKLNSSLVNIQTLVQRKFLYMHTYIHIHI